MVGVKLELVSPEGPVKNLGAFRVHVDMAAVDTQGTGSVIAMQALEVARLVEASLNDSQSFDRKSLCIVPGADGLAWCVYLDIVVLGTDGALVDVVSLGVRAALHNLMLPKISPVRSALVEQLDFSVSDDPADSTLMETGGVPVFVTVLVFGSAVAVDPTLAEEEAADSCLFVSVNRAGQVCFCKQAGTTGLSPELLLQALSVAREAAATVLDVQNTFLAKEITMQRPKTFLVLN